MHAILDTHLHLYPEYDFDAAFDHFLERTTKADASKDQSALKIACLAERHDCHFFSAFSQAKIQLQRYSVEVISDKELKLLRTADGASLHLIPGRQVISAENIEVLALGCLQDISDGLSAASIIDQCKQAGAIAVVAWSPGKWFGKRSQVVKALLQRYSPSDFLIGDTSLRPLGWSLPWLMRKALNQGFTVVAGSDPLPFKGEEKWFGAYCSHMQTESETPALELLRSIGACAGNITVTNRGNRSDPLSLLTRLRGNARSKRSVSRNG